MKGEVALVLGHVLIDWKLQNISLVYFIPNLFFFPLPKQSQLRTHKSTPMLWLPNTHPKHLFAALCSNICKSFSQFQQHHFQKFLYLCPFFMHLNSKMEIQKHKKSKVTCARGLFILMDEFAKFWYWDF